MSNHDKKKLGIGLGIVGLFIFGIIGFTYAFFTASVEGNPSATPTVVETADLRLVFNDTELIIMDNVLPGANSTKTFTISNIGNRRIDYDINIIDITNTFISGDLIYSLASTNDGAIVTEESLPDANTTLVSGSIYPGVTQVYTMTILFKETGANQNTNLGAEFSGKLQINTQTAYSDEVAFEIEETIGTVMLNQTKEIKILGSNYGKVSCESENINIAECTPSQNVITILGKNSGTTNIIVTEDNKKTETIYTITVALTFYDKILVDNNALSDSTINFDSALGDGFYYTANNQYGEDNTRIYYFRGRVDNNWVSFATKLWRIVRTTSESGIKLVYSGDGTSASSGFISTTKVFNSNYNNKYYVGYTYNPDLNSYTGTQINSTIKTTVDDWYSPNLSSYENYISDKAIYCNDRSSEMINGSYMYYPAYNRIKTNYRPSYACAPENASRYSVSAETGNGYLLHPISLLTADEINYAGVRWNTDNMNSYILDNATSNRWWTLSPYYLNDSNAFGFYVASTGNLSSSYLNNNYAVRPTISLKPCITVSGGNGNKSTPYIISSSTCT